LGCSERIEEWEIFRISIWRECSSIVQENGIASSTGKIGWSETAVNWWQGSPRGSFHYRPVWRMEIERSFRWKTESLTDDSTDGISWRTKEEGNYFKSKPLERKHWPELRTLIPKSSEGQAGFAFLSSSPRGDDRIGLSPLLRPVIRVKLSFLQLTGYRRLLCQTKESQLGGSLTVKVCLTSRAATECHLVELTSGKECIKSLSSFSFLLLNLFRSTLLFLEESLVTNVGTNDIRE
jgi:hypothetical protein